jgi:hypothetical protein
MSEGEHKYRLYDPETKTLYWDDEPFDGPCLSCGCLRSLHYIGADNHDIRNCPCGSCVRDPCKPSKFKYAAHRIISHTILAAALSDWPDEVKYRAIVILHEYYLLLGTPAPIFYDFVNGVAWCRHSSDEWCRVESNNVRR